MKKRFLAGLLALAMVFSLLPLGVVAETEPRQDHAAHSDWTAWDSGSALPGTEGNYYLTGDVALSTTARITTAQKITVCLNGYKIEGPQSNGGIFRLENGADVTICDCTAQTDGEGNYTAGQLLPRCSAAGGVASLAGTTGASFTLQDGIIDGAGRSYSNDGAAVVINKQSTFRMEGGEIRNFATTNCGIVRVYIGSFYMTGGKITEISNTGSVDGIAVRIDSGSTMYMSGGEISHNTSKTAAGAAINVASGGTLELSGGEISGNSAPNGAALVVNGTLKMTGGTICNNTGTANGAGMYINPNGKAEISGGSIAGNTAPNGAGIYCVGKLTVTGGTVSGNAATGKGGGLYASKAAAVTLSGGTFTGNSAATGGGICMDQSGAGSLTGVKITENTAATAAGVYYAATGSTLLGGSTVITGNLAGEQPSNLYLAAGKRLLMDGAQPLIHGAAVGISLSSVPTSTVVLATGTPQQDAAEYITMDAPVEEFSLQVSGSLRYSKVRQLQHPVAGYDKAGHDGSWTAWENSDTLPTQSGRYVLTGDVLLAGPMDLSGNGDITLCLNGNSIMAASGQRAFRLSGGVKLTLCDCTAHYDEEGQFVTGSVTGGAGTAQVSNAALTVYDCILSDGTDAQAGALLLGDGAQVEIYGSLITGHRSTGGSGGGAICVQGGSLLLQDTKVTGNSAGEAGGSAIFANGNAELTIRDCQITGNMHTATSVTWRGAVYLLKGTVKCTVSGSTVIDENYLANGKVEGNLFFQNDDARITVDQLTQGARIGVLTKNTVTESAPIVFAEQVTQANAGDFFHSDRSHAITLQDGKLSVGVRKHTAHETDGCGHENVTWQAWNNQLTTPGHYYLTQDLTLSKHLEFNTQGEFTLCLNGYNVCCPSGDRAFKLIGGAKLNLCDCNAHTDSQGNYTAGRITGGNTAEGAAVFIYHKDSVFTLYDGIITGNTSQGDSSKGIVLVVSGQFVMRGGLITGNTSKNGMVWLNGAGASFRMEDGRITENTVTSLDSGAVHMHQGTFTMTGGEISLHNAKGVQMNQDAVFTMSGGIITGNTSQRDGAGVRLDTEQAVFTMTGGEISENISTGAAGGIQSKGTVVLSGGTVRGNRAVNGGGLCVTGGTFTLDGGEVCENTATGTGAGIYLFGTAVMTLKSGTVRANTAEQDGAGIYVNDATLEMLGGEITGNVTGVSGGGVIVRGANGKMLLRDGTVKENLAMTDGLGNAAGILVQGKGTLEMYGGTVTGNKASVNGGGIQNYFSNAHLYGGTVSNNTAGNEGGGVHCSGGIMTLGGTAVTGNRAKAAGGVQVAQASTVKMSGGKISNNSVQNDGGGVVIQGKSQFTMTGGTISGNSSLKTGGGVYVAKDSDLLLQSGSVADNTAQGEGAGLYINSGYVVMTGGAISGNVTQQSGAGVVVRGTGASMELRGGEIRGNKAMNPQMGHGGGVLIQSGGKLTVSGGKITQNQVAGNGAGIYNSKMDLRITGGSVCENTTVGEGAGIYANGGTVTLDGGSVDNNETTKGNGGGICGRGGAQLFLKSGSVSGNKSAAHAGGILLQSGAKLVMEGGQVANNEAVISGGGIRSAGCEIEIYGGKITDNISGELGGGIYAEKKLTVKDCEISGNQIITANGGAGAGIRLGAGAEAYLENVIFDGNTAIGRGGAYDTAYSCTTTMVNCTFTNNFTTSNGAAIDSGIVGTMNLIGCTFRDNKTDGYGGVFYGEANGSYRFENCVLENNSATIGGAVYVKASGRTDFVNTQIIGNTATIMASAIHSASGVFFTDTTVTGNTDQSGGCAVYLTNEATDGESYVPCVNQFRGTVTIADNPGGDLVLGEKTAVNVHGDGLGAASKIVLSLSRGGIQRFLTGPYDYSRGGDVYTLTAGEGSLTRQDPVTEPEQPEETTPATEPVEEQEESGNTVTIVVIVAVIALALAAMAALIVRKVKKH